MFRRVRRLLRGGPPPPPHGRPDVPPALRHAHRLMDEGEFGEAELVFHDLAKKAEDRFPERAPFLYFEAGHAAIMNGENKKGVSHFRSGLTLLGTQQRFHRLRTAGGRIADELRERGLIAEAEEVESVVRNNDQAPAQREAQHVPKRGTLPTHCPSCGAAMHPNEVEWLDDATAECDYCGSPVRVE